MKIEAAFLLRPGNGMNADGAFYIAICDSRAHFTIHGKNSASTGGRCTEVKDSKAARQKVREKASKTYTHVPPSQITKAARDHAVTRIRNAYPNLKDIAPVFENDGISFPGVGDSTQPKARPKSNKTRLDDMWF